MNSPVAIVGMACRFPDAPNPQALWQNMLDRRTSFRRPGRQRWDHSRFYSPSPRDADRTYAETVAHLDDVTLFAGLHFGIASRRAEAMDPQQRIFLELVHQALQDAGLERRPWDRSRSAILVGASVCEYKELNVIRQRAAMIESGDFGTRSGPGGTERARPMRGYSFPGSMNNMIASAVAQAFDLGGPAYSLDAACASSLAALAQAVAHLQATPPEAGPAPVALAGGVYVNLLPDNLVGFARVGAIARSQCRPFDAQAEGFVLGEGAGVLVLKRLDLAQRDGDRIYAIVRGVALNSDGRGNNPLAPRLEGQVALLRQGLSRSGVDPAAIAYVECHGTGTLAGDASELQALNQGLTPRGMVRLGSIKANIGHTMSAAGVAGLLRAALAIYHATLPPQAGFERWHPSLKPLTGGFHIDDRAQPWQDPTRIALINSFAFGGTNAMAILESAPLPAPPPTGGEPSEWLFCFSAPTPMLLEEYRRDWLAAARGQSLSSLAYTQTLARQADSRHCGTVVVARNFDDLAAPTPIFPLAPGPLHLPEITAQERSWLEDRGVQLNEQGLRMESFSRLESLGYAWLLGQPIKLDDLFPDRRLADLPPVPLARQPYWIIQSIEP